MTAATAGPALALPRGGVLVVGALAGGYLLGTVPVAWLLVRRARRGRLEVPPAPAPLGRNGRPGTLEALAAGGMRAAGLVIALELLKGAAAGLGARLYDDAPWFTASAIAGCVVGDAFPLGVRRGRRGIVPLISGVFAALPGAWAAGAVIALPALLLLLLTGVAYEGLVAITVPAAFVLGTRDWRTLGPALLIVAALVARNRLRRAARMRARADWARLRGREPVLVVDAEPGGRRGGVPPQR